MKEQRLNKLVYSGKSNFIGNFILKVTDGLFQTINQKEEALIVSNETPDHVIKNASSYPVIILQPDTKQKIDQSTQKQIHLNEFVNLKSGDIIEINSIDQSARILVVFRINSNDNTLIITNACNSKCIMCPGPINRPSKIDFSFDRVKNIVELIDKGVKNLCISGGEPTLIKRDLVKVLSVCKTNIPNTELSVITNGRMFFYQSFVEEIQSVSNRTILFCVPIHSHKFAIHDQITLVKNSFDETVIGIKNLLSLSLPVEVRVVIQKDNYKDLEDISTFIISNFPNVYRIAFIGMEMSGSARKNMDAIWVSYSEFMPYLVKASNTLISNGIQTNIFNIPLCKTDPMLRNISVQSISDYKIRFLPECEVCTKMSICGGSFLSSVDLLKDEGVEPIVYDS